MGLSTKQTDLRRKEARASDRQDSISLFGGASWLSATILELKGENYKGIPLNSHRQASGYKMIPAHYAGLFTHLFEGAAVLGMVHVCYRLVYCIRHRKEMKRSDWAALAVDFVKAGLLFTAAILQWVGKATLAPMFMLGFLGMGALQSAVQFVKSLVAFAKNPCRETAVNALTNLLKLTFYVLAIAATVALVCATATLMATPVGGLAGLVALGKFFAKYPKIARLGFAASVVALSAILLKPIMALFAKLKRAVMGEQAKPQQEEAAVEASTGGGEDIGGEPAAQRAPALPTGLALGQA